MRNNNVDNTVSTFSGHKSTVTGDFMSAEYLSRFMQLDFPGKDLTFRAHNRESVRRASIDESVMSVLCNFGERFVP